MAMARHAKITILPYCPAVIRPAYLTGEGRDTIIELALRVR
jgi:hypothetical protein